MGNVVEITVKATDNASKKVGDVKASLTDLSRTSAAPEIDLKGSEAAVSAIDSVDVSLADLSKASAIPNIDLRGSDEAIADAHDVGAALSSLGRQTATPDIEVKGSAAAIAESTAASEAIKNVGNSSSKAASEAGGFGEKLSGLAESAMPALIGAGVVLSPVMTTLSAGMGGFGLAVTQTVSPIIAAASATGGLQANMSTLSPVQQQMARQLVGLQGEAGKFTASLQPEVVKGWGAAMGLAGNVLGDLQPVAKATGDALDGVIGDIDADLKTTEWQGFFQFMGQTAGPDMKLLGTLFTSLINDLPPLLEGLQPVATEFLTLADGAARAVGALENMPAQINKVSDSNGSLLSKASDFLNFVGSKIPDGNRSLVSLAQSWLQSGDASSKASGQMANGAQAVVTPVDALATAMAGAATDTKSLDTAWTTLVGNFNGEQQAIVAAQQAVIGYGTAVKESGSKSLAAQSAFYAAVSSLQQMTDAEVKNHAPAAQLYSDLQKEISALKSKGPLNSAERTDLANLEKAADAAAASTGGLTKAQLSSASSIEHNFAPQLKALHTDGTQDKTDMDNLAKSILNTGTQSKATQKYRAQLISDLENSGVGAKTATSYVNGLTKSLGKVPRSVTSVVTVEGKAQGTLTAISTTLGGQTAQAHLSLGVARAEGGLISGPGGPRDDKIPARLSNGEYVVQASAVGKYGRGMLDAINTRRYASGGSVDLDTAPGFVNSQDNSWAHTVGSQWAKDNLDAFHAALNAVAAASTTQGLIHPTGTGGSVQSLMKSMAASVGWTGPQWTALYDVEEREAGFNLRAQNPSSGAYGLAQFINGASEYAQYGGNSTTAQGQITGMLNYVRERYGSPENAWQHELNYGWYDKGGWLQPGYTLAYNGTGKPEAVGGAGGAGNGSQSITLEVTSGGQSAFEQFMLVTIRELVRVKGGGSAQAAFGRH